MIEFKAAIRKWGDSLGVTIPRDIVRRYDLKTNEEVKVLIPHPPKPMNISKIAGRFKCEIPTHELIDRARTEED